MLKIINLNKSYNDTQILQDFNLEIAQGKSIAIIGSSGSGKSTLLNILGGIDGDYTGDVVINNQNISTLSEKELTKFRAENFGFVYQFHHLLQDFTALENVCMPLLINKYNKNDAIKLATDILEKVGMGNKLKNFPSQLSGGQRQRIAIARAVVSKPKIIFADEPTGNLDSKNSMQVIELLMGLQKDNNSSLIIVTHNDQIAKITDKVLELK